MKTIYLRKHNWEALGFLKSKLWFAKDTVKRMRTWATNWENIFVKDVSDKFNRTKTKTLLNLIKNGPKTWTGTSPKKIYRIQISIWKVLNNSISHVIREMQVKIAGSCCSTAVTLPHWRKQGRSLVVDGDVGSRSRSGRPSVTWASLIAASSAGKESAYNAGDPCSIPGLGRSAGEGIGYPLLYSWASLVA